MSFKHSTESENLEGFEKKFYDAIVEVATILCEGVDAKPKSDVKVEYTGKDKDHLIVTASVNVRGLSVDIMNVERYAYALCGHFPAFFTPAHYRPYMNVEPSLKTGNYIDIVGIYKDGV